MSDGTYKTAAPTATTSKFGPSGSSKNIKSDLEHTKAVAPKINNEYLLDSQSIFIQSFKHEQIVESFNPPSSIKPLKQFTLSRD